MHPTLTLLTGSVAAISGTWRSHLGRPPASWSRATLLEQVLWVRAPVLLPVLRICRPAGYSALDKPRRKAAAGDAIASEWQWNSQTQHAWRRNRDAAYWRASCYPGSATHLAGCLRDEHCPHLRKPSAGAPQGPKQLPGCSKQPATAPQPTARQSRCPRSTHESKSVTYNGEGRVGQVLQVTQAGGRGAPQTTPRASRATCQPLGSQQSLSQIPAMWHSVRLRIRGARGRRDREHWAGDIWSNAVARWMIGRNRTCSWK